MQLVGTWNALSENTKKISNENKIVLKPQKEFTIGDLNILPFKTPHDALEPCGFNIYNGSSKISIATDLGYIDEKLMNNFKNSSFLMLESNYEPDILKVSSYPYMLKTRIAGPYGHLSNGDAGIAISKLINTGLKDVLLVHLSKENNVPEIAYETVLEKLRLLNCNENSINLQVAPRNNPSKLFNVI